MAGLRPLHLPPRPDRHEGHLHQGRQLTHLLRAAGLLVSDLASTILFLIVFLTTKDLVLAAVLGMGLGLLQIGWQFARKAPIDTMQWMSLFLILASGAATLLTSDARFIMVKPSIIYIIVGVVMLKPGWMNRYMPPIALELLSDVVFVFGFVWAGLMFGSAALNLAVAFSTDAATWSIAMSIWGLASKIGLFLVQYGTMRLIGRGRRLALAAAT